MEQPVVSKLLPISVFNAGEIEETGRDARLLGGHHTALDAHAHESGVLSYADLRCAYAVMVRDEIITISPRPPNESFPLFDRFLKQMFVVVSRETPELNRGDAGDRYRLRRRPNDMFELDYCERLSRPSERVLQVSTYLHEFLPRALDERAATDSFAGREEWRGKRDVRSFRDGCAWRQYLDAAGAGGPARRRSHDAVSGSQAQAALLHAPRPQALLASEAVRPLKVSDEGRQWILEDLLLERPGEFEYTSFCPLGTPFGSMRGTYQMVTDKGEMFDATIAPFALAEPLSIN